jgi:hypothetical protein
MQIHITKNRELRTKNKIIILCLLLSVLCFLVSTPVRAQSLSLSIAPPLLEVLIKPGKTITQVYKLANHGEGTIVTPLVKELDTDGIVLNNTFTRENWIEILNKDIFFDKPFFLKAGEERQIVLKVSPPKDLPEKDYYRVLLFATSPALPAESSQSQISQNIGSILLLNITSTGMKTKSAQIINIDLPTLVDSFGPLTSNITVKNTGNTFFRPIGEITLTGMIGRASFPIVPNIFLSGETRTLATSDAANKNRRETLYLPGFYLGKYNLSIFLTLDEGTIKISQTKTFYALPWKAGAGILLVVFFLSIMKKRKRKK